MSKQICLLPTLKLHTLLQTLSHSLFSKPVCTTRKKEGIWVTHHGDDGTRCKIKDIVFALQEKRELLSNSPNPYVFSPNSCYYQQIVKKNKH